MNESRITLTPLQSRAVIGVLLLAVVLRLFWFLVHPIHPVGDTRVFLNLASNLVNSGTFGVDGLVADRPPGWPAVMAGFMLLGGERSLDPTLMNLVFGAFSVALIFALGAQIFSVRVGLLTALLLALYANHIALSATLATEPMFLVLWLTALFTLITAMQNNRTLLFALAGMIFGLATLTRPTPLGLMVLLLLGTLVKREFLGHGRRQWLLLLLLWASVMAPWTIRNAVLLDAFVPVSSNGGMNLYMGNNAEGTVEFVRWGSRLYLPFAGLDEMESNDLATSLAVSHMVTHPFVTIMAWPEKLYELMRPEIYFAIWHPEWERAGIWQHLAIIFGNWVWILTLFGMGLWAIGLAMRRRGFRLVDPLSDEQRLLLLVIAAWVALHLLMWGMPRFRHGIEPLMMLFAVAGLNGFLTARHTE